MASTEGADVEAAKKASLSSAAKGATLRFGKIAQKVKNAAAISRRPQVPLNLLRSAAVNALKSLKFINQTGQGDGWAAVEAEFNTLTEDTNGMLPRPLICQCIGMNESAFAERLLDTLVKKRNIEGDSVTKEQLQSIWDQISNQSSYAKLRTFFDMLDKDADGRITVAEVKEVIILSASSNKLANIKEQAEEFAALIVEALDPDKLGYINIGDLDMPLSRASSRSSSTREDSENPSHVAIQELKYPISQPNPLVARLRKSSKYLVLENWKRIWVMALWIGAMAGLFAYKYAQYRNRAVYQVMGVCVCMAKGAAETLKLNMALILLPVCRNTITWLRNKTKLGSLVPFDDNLNFHQVIAIGIAIGSGVHVLAHMSCDFPRLIEASSEEYKPMEPFFGTDQPKSYFHFVKSVEGVTGIVMVLLMAIAFTLAAPCFRTGGADKKPKLIRKLTGFNAFWYSHHLFVIVYALLIVHGIKLYLTHEWYKKTTWMYLAVPVTLYACERLTRALRSTIKEVNISDAPDLPGNVLALQMSKPPGFTYRSGQYMFIKCKDVSPFEWHPFSITSCPSDEYLSVHIRASGDWTKQLKTVFEKARKSQPNEKHGDGLQPPKYPKVSIDGPYGAPAQEYKKYEVVVLVGLGIGATPMISIVKDILNNIKSMEPKESKLENGHLSSDSDSTKRSSSSSSSSEFKTKRVYFYWMTREQGSFYWFKNVMDEVARSDRDGVIEMHNHCTSVYEEGDVRSALVAMLQAISLAKTGRDVVFDTRFKTHFAKPNWHDVFEGISNNHRDERVGVFYCGPQNAVKKIKEEASYFSEKNNTRFDFHKENF